VNIRRGFALGLLEWSVFEAQPACCVRCTRRPVSLCFHPKNAVDGPIVDARFLLGKYKAAIEVYNEANRATKEDRDVHFNLGLCYRQLKLYDKAIGCFKEANDISKNEETFQQIGRTYSVQEDFKNAVATYLDALQFSNDNEDLLAAMGLLYLRLGEPAKAFNYLERALARNPGDPKVILAAGSIIQDRNEMNKALLHYRIAAVKTPNSAQLWNNIGQSTSCLTWWPHGRGIGYLTCDGCVRAHVRACVCVCLFVCMCLSVCVCV
jgi:tetratricopeptide (TPR) repeat protein